MRIHVFILFIYVHFIFMFYEIEGQKKYILLQAMPIIHCIPIVRRIIIIRYNFLKNLLFHSLIIDFRKHDINVNIWPLDGGSNYYIILKSKLDNLIVDFTTF